MLVLEVIYVVILSPFFPAGRGWTWASAVRKKNCEINVYNQYTNNNSLTMYVDGQQTSGSN